MNLYRYRNADDANTAAARTLASWLMEPDTHQVLVAAGNTPLALYEAIALSGLAPAHLDIFVLDEYVGVPPEHPRNCSNLLKAAVAEAWGISKTRFHPVSSVAANALESIREQEQAIARGGGLDVAILGLGQNGHLGFNEPGSTRDSAGRVVDLEAVSIEANRQWFQGEYAPRQGVTLGLKTLLAARRVIVLAFGSHKTAAVAAMVEGPISPQCPASFLREHPEVHLFLDHAAAAGLDQAP